MVLPGRAAGPFIHVSSPPPQVSLPTGGAGELLFSGSLLQLRGAAASSSPLAHPATGNVLLFNGEVFGGLGVAPGANDAAALLAALSSCEPPSIVRVLSALRGPWALVFWHAPSLTLWYGRDVLGRRSLLAHAPRSADGRLLLASAAPLDPGAPFEGFEEVVPGLHSVSFASPSSSPDGIDGAAGKLEGGVAHAPPHVAHAWADPQLQALSAFQRGAGLIEPPSLASQSRPGAAPPPAGGGDPALRAAADAVLAALRAAVRLRCRCIDFCSTEPRSVGAPGGAAAAALPPARLLVLFSGGVDSTLLAALAHEALPPDEPIDLATICFACGASPDRAAALDALQELRAAAPARRWRLIGVDARFADVEAASPRLRRLLAPADTVMDLNIGAALWLAAGAEGELLHPPPPPPPADSAAEGAPAARRYRSEARVVLLGHGADELFGGYGRHRTRFAAAGWQGLSEELRLDVRRLWRRNLGRDDRLVSDRGREARHPFLDEGVVAAALALPLHALVDLRGPPGAGDKRVLRECCARLGLPRAAARVKRAIQFGSRLAKAADAAHFGGTRRANARSAGGVRLSELPGAAGAARGGACVEAERGGADAE
jgi:asparagine synthetase B (glutamine-hydrolysing)